MKRNVLILLVTVLAVAWLQAAFLGLDRNSFLATTSDGGLATEYTRALAHGQSYLLPLPNPNARVFDSSFYNGRSYVYFGAAPVLLLPVPWLLVTGRYLSSEAQIWIFNLVGYVALGATLILVAERRFGGMRPGTAAGLFLGMFFGGFTWTLLSLPLLYEVENAAAIAAFSWAVFVLAWGELAGRTGRKYALAATLAGFAASCRPNFFPAVAVLVIFIVHRTRAEEGALGSRVRRGVARLMPLAVIGGAMLVWNVVRFGSPLDFGLKPFSQTSKGTGLLFTSLRNLPYDAERYLAGTFHLIRYFPFFAGPGDGWFQPVAHQEVGAWVYGCLWVTPFLFFGLLLLRALRRGSDPAPLLGLFFAGLGNLAYLCVLGFSAYRYAVDFMGPWLLLAALGALQIRTIPRRSARIGLRLVLGLSLAWTVVAGFCEAASIADAHNLMAERRPAAFQRMAAPFNAVVYVVERGWLGGPREVRFSLRFPKQRLSQVEPLLVTGIPSRQDFVYVYYLDVDKIQFGFESMGHGGKLSAPIRIDYAQPHQLDLFLGSALPPEDHPLLRGIPAATVARARSTVRVRLDGRTVFEMTGAVLHPDLGQFQLGRSQDDGAFGRVFTGEILAVHHPRIDPLEVGPR